MAGNIVPITQMNRRMPEQGRIRIGVKSGKAMKAIDSFRFTSTDHEAIEAIAGMYGGSPQKWNDGSIGNQMEVITEANEIRVMLPPDPMGGTPIYELWLKGGIQRRCDGQTAVVSAQGPDGYELQDVDCICNESQKLDCKPTTRINVILSDIRFGGTWRLETHGWNAAHELPGMVDMIAQMQTRGLPYALLALESRSKAVNGQTKKFVVPTLRLSVTPEQMMVGGGGPSLEAPPKLALVAGEDEIPQDDEEMILDLREEDDGIIDAEIVIDPPSHENDPVPPLSDNTMIADIVNLAHEMWGKDDTVYLEALCNLITNSGTDEVEQLDELQLKRMLTGLARVQDGETTVRLTSAGKAVIEKKE